MKFRWTPTETRLQFPMLAALLAIIMTFPANADGLDDMVGCWLSEDYPPTSLELDSSDPKSATIIHENSLLLFNRIKDTDYLVFGSLFEWNRQMSFVNGPVFQHGAYDPVSGTLTFGYPGGGLDTARLRDMDLLLYIHTYSGTDKSTMSVREMKRIDCSDAQKLSQALLERKNALSE
ncbi:hypothetical protein [Hoeflea sp. TYP-13]|uniref:hypothetical protein n=1 Tax=Hoeflea sp. TYP-13 TaxID=3230023 RepID=UPI0034C62749